MPKISIIIPVYNREDLVKETLDSVLAQTWTDWECLVVDDGSTDKSYEVLQEYAAKDNRIQAFQRPAERLKGACACRNVGFEHSSGELVYFLDADDLLSPQFAEMVIAAMNERLEEEFAIVPFNGFIESPDKPITHPRKHCSSESVLEERLQRGIGWSTQATIWRRRLLIREKMLWRDGLIKAQDTDFSYRVSTVAQGEGFFIDMPPLVHYRKHNHQMMSQVQCQRGIVFNVVADVYLNVFTVLEEKGKMNVSVKKSYFQGLLRAMMQNVIVFGDKKATTNMHRFIQNRCIGVPFGWSYRVESYCIYWLRPLLCCVGIIAMKYRKTWLVQRLKERYSPLG